MTDQDIIDKINRALAEEFELELEEMTPESHLVDDFDMDSLDFVDMIVILQNNFGLKLRDNLEIRKFKKLNEIHDFIIQNLNDSKK